MMYAFCVLIGMLLACFCYARKDGEQIWLGLFIFAVLLCMMIAEGNGW